MKKILTMVLIAVLMFQSIAFANVETVLDAESNAIIVNGESDNDNVSIVLLNPGYTILDTAVSTLSDAVLYYRPVAVENGEYTYTIKMPSSAQKGKYTLYADSDKKEIYYSSINERLSMIAEVKTAIIEDTLSSYLSENGVYLCDSDKFLNVEDMSKIASFTKDILTEKILINDSPESLSEITEALDFSVVLQLLNEEKIEGVSELEKVVNEENMALKYSQKALIPANKQADIIDRISGNNITSEDDFYNALMQSIFIGVINESKSLSSTERRKFFDDYATDVSLDISDYSSLSDTKRNSVIAQLSAAKKTTISDMQKKLDELYENEKPAGGGGASGGGGDNSFGDGSSSHISASGMGGGTVPEAIKPSEPNISTEKQESSFKDMKNYSWAEDAVNALSKNKIINGYTDGTFKPEGTITRGEFTAMIARAFLPENSGNNSNFEDVNVNDWYYKFVMSAYENNIISGMGDGKFLPNEKIRRCDMVVILNNLLSYKGVVLEGGNLVFDDVDSIPQYAMQAVTVLNKNGIINGDDNNNLRPNDFANRAEAAVMLYRFINIVNREGV